MMDLSGFAGSAQGQEALQKLQAQGFAGPQAEAMLTSAVPAAAEAMRGIAKGDKTLPKFSESNYVMNFTAGAVSGLIRGQGFMGSAIDGMQGMVGGYIAQVIAARFGLPKRTAGVIGAVITPMAIDFIWAKLEGSGGEPQPQQLPTAPGNPYGAPQLATHQAPQLPPAHPYAPAYGPPRRGYGYALQAQQPGYSSPGHSSPQYPPNPGYYGQQQYPAYGAGASAQVPGSPPGYSQTGYQRGQGYRR